MGIGTYQHLRSLMRRSHCLFYFSVVPTSPPGNVTAYNTSKESIRVEWTRPAQDTIPGYLIGYEVSYTPALAMSAPNVSFTRRVMLCACNTSVVLTNLSVYTLYNITVAAFTKVGIGNESYVTQTSTEEDG